MLEFNRSIFWWFKVKFNVWVCLFVICPDICAHASLFTSVASNCGPIISINLIYLSLFNVCNERCTSVTQTSPISMMSMCVCVFVSVINAHCTWINKYVWKLMHLCTFIYSINIDVCVCIKRLHISTAHPNIITNSTLKLNHMHG